MKRASSANGDPEEDRAKKSRRGKEDDRGTKAGEKKPTVKNPVAPKFESIPDDATVDAGTLAAILNSKQLTFEVQSELKAELALCFALDGSTSAITRLSSVNLGAILSFLPSNHLLNASLCCWQWARSCALPRVGALVTARRDRVLSKRLEQRCSKMALGGVLTGDITSMSLEGSALCLTTDAGGLGAWNVATGEQTGQVDLAHESSILCCHSIFGAILATGGDDGAIRLWKTGQLDLRRHYFLGESKQVSAVQISSQHVFGGWSYGRRSLADWLRREHGGNIVQLDLNVDTAAATVATFVAHKAEITTLQLVEGSNGLQLLSASKDGLMKLWDVRQQHQVSSWTANGEAVSCSVLRGSTLVSGTADGFIRVWDLRSVKPVCSVEMPQSELRPIPRYQMVKTLYHDGQRLVTGSYACSPAGMKSICSHVDIWDLPSLRLQSTDVVSGHRVTAVRFEPDTFVAAYDKGLKHTSGYFELVRHAAQSPNLQQTEPFV
eukprot:GILJ01005980.1.p1 GENE.GILJ01005980.1~~GILJ01005980.1.p1  ORF type:complete len:506 (+),score=62.01 GILJ01005980.1:38-1519(+)